MSYRKSTEKLAALRSKILELRSEMRDVQAHIEPDPVADHTFETITGKVQLSELFGTHKDLFVVHNMGASCSYCTLWADGYNGLVPHIESRAAFVVVSPDKPAAQAAFAKKRGWGFRLVSDPDSGFAKAMD